MRLSSGSGGGVCSKSVEPTGLDRKTRRPLYTPLAASGRNQWVHELIIIRFQFAPMSIEPAKDETTPTERNRLYLGSRAAMGLGHVGLVLGVIALVLGASGLAIALTNGGHTGETGARGAPGTDGTNGTNGTAGPGALVNETYVQYVQALTASCGYYSPSDVNFTVSGPGMLVVTASVLLELSHTTSASTVYFVSLASTSLSCNVTYYSNTFGIVQSPEPTAIYWTGVSLAQTFSLPAAGTYTICLIGDATMTDSGDFSYFYSASVVGVFYPA